MSTTPRRRGAALRRSANAFSTRETRERPSRRSTVMRLCIKQPANIRVTRRRSDLVSPPRPPPREIEVLTTVVPYQLRSGKNRPSVFEMLGFYLPLAVDRDCAPPNYTMDRLGSAVWCRFQHLIDASSSWRKNPIDQMQNSRPATEMRPIERTPTTPGAAAQLEGSEDGKPVSSTKTGRESPSRA